MEAKHQEEAGSMESKFKAEQDRLFAQEKAMREELYELQKENTALKQKESETEVHVAAMTEELELLRRAHEEETKVRIKFETKVNSLHALHRNLEAKYTRAIRDIHELEKVD